VTVTSRTIRHVTNHIAGGRHVLLTGRIDDLQLHRGEALTLRASLERIGRSFDVVVRMDAVDGATVVHGEDRWQPDGEPRRDPLSSLRDLLHHPELSTMVILEQADILLQDPSHHDVPDRTRIATLQLALAEATTNGTFGNTCVLVAASAADVPGILRAGSERLAVVDIGLPIRAERQHYLLAQVPQMHGVAHLDNAQIGDLVKNYCRLTEDEPLRGIESLTRFSRAARVDATDARNLLHRHRFGEAPDYWSAVRQDLDRIATELRASVFGQETAVDAVVAGLAGAALGLNMNGDPFGLESQPRLVLLLLGPTGVGKTELAKALARALFGDASAYTRIDMALFAQEHAADRLTGAPPGYVGFEAGGELTNAVRARPFSVILLDEFEKAHPRAHDRMMSVIDDGRVTDAQGRVAYFGESIILMTSNLGSRQLAERAAQSETQVEPAAVDLSSLNYEEVAAVFESAARDYFTEIGRVEIWGRLAQGAVAFQPLRPEMIEQITAKVLADTTFVHGPELDVDAASANAYADAVMAEPVNRNLGGRQIRNIFRSAFLRVACWTVLGGHADAGRLIIRFEPDGAMRVSVDGATEELIPVTRRSAATGSQAGTDRRLDLP